MNTTELREKSVDELQTQLLVLLREQFMNVPLLVAMQSGLFLI